jgi:arylsulfatase A-like enzyme
MFLSVAMALAAAVGSQAAEAGGPLNVLVLIADDWRYDTLGCAGDPVVMTPQLDRLAAEGVRFTHACVTTAVCGVSRASILTGQWMSRHGTRTFEMFTTPWEQTYPGILRAQGYWVGHIGKWHNGPFPKGRFDVGSAFSGTHWITQPDGSKIHVTQKVQDEALAFLATRPRDRPFCLTLANFAPHAEDANPLQYLPQPQSADLYRALRIPVPPTATDEALRRLPEFLQSPLNESRKRWHWRFDEPEKYQAMMKNYYRLCTEADAGSGRVIDQLRAEGILDRTLVVFIGDNGYFHGEHGLADKWYAYEESLRVPLIIRDPRLPVGRRGVACDEFALNVDVAPTVLAALAVAAPTTMQGRDLAPLYLAQEKPAWRQEFLYEHATITSRERIPSSYALVRHDAKYVHWPEWNVEELFDLRADQGELRNLAADPAHAGALEEMRSRCLQLQEQAK